MLVRSYALLAFLAKVTFATTITVFNNCTAPIDPAFFPAADNGVGGFALGAGQSHQVTLSSGYSGRAWGRTQCDSEGNCITGGCEGGVDCTAPAAAGPTLAQFTTDGFASLDFYTLTVTDGFNLPITVIAGAGCSTAPVSCTSDTGEGDDCGGTASCPTGTAYTIQFC